MLRTARPFIMLILLLALPLQGVAAAAADLCMAMGHHEAGAMAHDHAQDRDHHDHHDHGHDVSQHAPSSSDEGQDGVHCPPCAACCVAAHMAAASSIAVTALPTPEPLSAADFSRAQTLPGELDRPPLSL
jgi:hypothetical protein